MTRDALRVTREVTVWMLGFIAIVFIGGSLTMDLSGQSAADVFVIQRWSFEGLRIYLWLEALVLSAIVAALGAHVVATGFGMTRGATANLFGFALRLRPIVPRQFGYMFVVLGAALIALSITTLVLFNSCRYMRIV